MDATTILKARGKSIVWILTEGHRNLPKEFHTLNLRLYRLGLHPKINLPIFSSVIDWDWRRVDQNPAECAPNESIPSIDELPPNTEDALLFISGTREFAEKLSGQLQRKVHWLSIGGNGATDRQAVWASWLKNAPSISIELFSCCDGKRWERFGARELRVHRSSPALTQFALLRASIVLVEMLALGADPEPGFDAKRMFERRPSSSFPQMQCWFQSFRVSFRIASRTFKNRLFRSSELNDQWVIGITEIKKLGRKNSLPEFPQFQDVHWIRPAPHRFIADPFLVRIGKTLTLFFEELFYSEWKGRLKALPLDASGRPAGPEVTVLEKPYHLSFPLVFEHPSEPQSLFLVPEQGQSGKTVLYSSAKPTEVSAIQFHEDTTLLPGFPGIDPVICEFDGRFYLFVSNGSYGNYDNNLHLFVSENLRGPYRAHPQSPIRLGLRGSRMAGPLVRHGDKLYRPAQDCLHRYGAQIIFFRVDVLSPFDYRETEVAIFSPDPASPYGFGCHTVVWYEGLVAIDGLRQIAVSGGKMGI
jgi:hypothetical protein